jgi:hypothetical protein
MIDIAGVQLLVFEIGEGCNLGHLHDRCPNHMGVDRYERLDCSHLLDDATIIETAKTFYGQHGFAGMVAWHYFCEPLLYAERMFGLIARIRHAVPQSRFLLWTNGTQLPSDCAAFAVFDRIQVTDYDDDESPRHLEALRRACPRVDVQWAQFDGRLTGLGEPPGSDRPCKRPYTEFVVDCFGNVHLCCQDWRGLASPGNVLRDGLDACVAKWRTLARSVVGERMTPDAPEACRRCERRYAEATAYA